MNHRHKNYSLLLIVTMLATASCKKFVDVGPPTTQLVTETVYSTDATAMAAINGIYSMMMNAAGFANWSVTQYGGLSSDEYINYSPSPDLTQFYTNSLNAQNPNVQSFWTQGYQYIYMANAVLEGLANSSTVSGPVKAHLQAEAKFIRAFCYFYLVNFYGPVPLAVHTDYTQNTRLSRSPVDSVYQLITEDLLAAASGLPSDFSGYGNTRLRPTSWAAYGLLSRVYLYTGQWAAAEAAANKLLEGNSLFKLETDLNNVFLPASQEAIWQISAVSTTIPTYEGSNNILTTSPNSQALRPSLRDSFETGDNRKTSWINSYTKNGITYYFAFKFKVKSITKGTSYPEYTTPLRLAEIYLVRAEARLAQQNTTGALSDINAIRHRAGLSDTTTTDPASLAAILLRERQLELFCEWGHRWLDLKRLHLAGLILSAVKATTWNQHAEVFPIPSQEISSNNHLTQNEGYQ